jgi:hypothetical protein
MHINIDQPILPLIPAERDVPQMMHLTRHGLWKRHDVPYARALAGSTPMAQSQKSFFASFCSQKEVLALLYF